jgi:hypothetical protein
MEFDINPKHIKSPFEASVVFEFMKKMLNNTGKDIFLTLENTPDYRLFTVKADGRLHIHN